MIFFVDGVEIEKRRKGKCKRKEIYYNFVNREEYEMERKNFGKRGKKKNTERGGFGWFERRITRRVNYAKRKKKGKKKERERKA